jgi:hypothetical protein
MTMHLCLACGTMWPEPPLLADDGTHETWKLERCEGAPEPFMPERFASPPALKLMMTEARLERALAAHEKLADRLTVERGGYARAWKALGRNARGWHEARKRIAELEALLALPEATTRRLLLRADHLLASLATSRRECPSCGLRADHRYNCRLVSCRRAIFDSLDSPPPRRRQHTP